MLTAFSKSVGYHFRGESGGNGLVPSRAMMKFTAMNCGSVTLVIFDRPERLSGIGLIAPAMPRTFFPLNSESGRLFPGASPAWPNFPAAVFAAYEANSRFASLVRAKTASHSCSA